MYFGSNERSQKDQKYHSLKLRIFLISKISPLELRKSAKTIVLLFKKTQKLFSLLENNVICLRGNLR